MNKLQNKVAVITGGNSGIGFATAKRFAEEGASVIITGRRADAVEAAAAELGPNVAGLVGDAGDLDDIDRIVAAIKERHGRIDVLFLNAGIAPMDPLEEVEVSTFDQLFRVNVKGPFFTVQKALPLLGEGSSVIFNASVVASLGLAGASVYSATKAATRSFGRTLAAELAPRGIRLNILSPGPIETPIYGKVGMSQEQVDEMGKRLAGKVPLGRFGSADEMAKVALFLASDDASYLTGADIQADGGMTQVLAA